MKKETWKIRITIDTNGYWLQKEEKKFLRKWDNLNGAWGGGEQSISYYTHQALSQVWIEGGGCFMGESWHF